MKKLSDHSGDDLLILHSPGIFGLECWKGIIFWLVPTLFYVSSLFLMSFSRDFNFSALFMKTSNDFRVDPCDVKISQFGRDDDLENF